MQFITGNSRHQSTLTTCALNSQAGNYRSCKQAFKTGIWSGKKRMLIRQKLL